MRVHSLLPSNVRHSNPLNPIYIYTIKKTQPLIYTCIYPLPVGRVLGIVLRLKLMFSDVKDNLLIPNHAALAYKTKHIPKKYIL